jgi:hypothetical protein
MSLDVFREWLGGDMPLPAMMLGVTGERGNRVVEVIAALRRGLDSDGVRPTGTVYFVTSGDIRSQCRQWQFPVARQELGRRGVEVSITNAFPEGQRDVLGLMMGAADVEPGRVGKYLPGSMAEHLTSIAGNFHDAGQTKLSAWIAAGASLTAGTVTEPMSIWMKFPSAIFYVHYADGCTALESFCQSVRCPLQLLMVGDPLASPWASRGMTVSLAGLDDVVSGGSIRVTASVDIPGGGRPRSVYFLLAGRVAGRGHEILLDTGPLGSGKHTLRAVADRGGTLREQAFVEKEFSVMKGRNP